jgi:putative lipase involved disintegration of autophagic bodies
MKHNSASAGSISAHRPTLVDCSVRPYWCHEVLTEHLREFDGLFGATMEQAKNGSDLVNASEATTWIDIAYLEGRRSYN